MIQSSSATSKPVIRDIEEGKEHKLNQQDQENPLGKFGLGAPYLWPGASTLVPPPACIALFSTLFINTLNILEREEAEVGRLSSGKPTHPSR